MSSAHLVAVHLVAVLEGEGLAHGDGDGEAHNGDGEGVSDHTAEERSVGNQGGLQPGGRGSGRGQLSVESLTLLMFPCCK